jgi:hypothetical protein
MGKSNKKSKGDKRPGPRGTGATQRTPRNWYDPLINAHDQECKVGAIVGEAFIREAGREGPIFLIRWDGHDKECDSWEPMRGLPGLEDMIGAYRNEQEVRNAAGIVVEETRRGRPADAVAAAGDAAEKPYKPDTRPTRLLPDTFASRHVCFSTRG